MPDTLTERLEEQLEEHGFSNCSDWSQENDDVFINTESLKEIIQQMGIYSANAIYAWIGFDRHTDNKRALYVGQTRIITGRLVSGHQYELNAHPLTMRALGLRNALTRADVYIYVKFFNPTIDAQELRLQETGFIQMFGPCWNSQTSHTLDWGE